MNSMHQETSLMILLGTGLVIAIILSPLQNWGKKLHKGLFPKLRTTVTHKYMIYGSLAVLQFIPPNSLIKMALWEIALKEKRQSLIQRNRVLMGKKIPIDLTAADICSSSAGLWNFSYCFCY